MKALPSNKNIKEKPPYYSCGGIQVSIKPDIQI